MYLCETELFEIKGLYKNDINKTQPNPIYLIYIYMYKEDLTLNNQ